MKNFTSTKQFHIWNSFNFLLIVILIVMAVLRFGDRTKLIEATEISRLVYNWLAFACGFGSIGYFFLLRKKCGKMPKDIIWLAGGILLIIRGVMVHYSLKIFGKDVFPETVYIYVHAICLLVLISFLNINTMISINCFLKEPKKAHYAIIHGATTGSRVMNNRTDIAAQYLNDQKKVIAIGSGGQGSDEWISEGEYISQRLQQEGIQKERILVENKSTTTYENLAFSKKLMDEKAPFAVVTDDYHILRTRLIAKKVFGYMPEGLPVHSARVSLPYYVLREYFSLIYNSLKGNLF